MLLPAAIVGLLLLGALLYLTSPEVRDRRKYGRGHGW